MNSNTILDRSYYLKTNNFNLVRIFAAIQVFLTHGIQHLHIRNETIMFLYYKFLVYFPGVPVFYTISGFLIYASFGKKSGDIKNFYLNRFLRIYPGLIVCLVFTSGLLYLDFPGGSSFFSFGFVKWVGAQLTFFQFYTPDVLRYWGVGAPNGSLWTISVEIQFYLTIPIVYFLFKKSNRSMLMLIGIFILSVIINITYDVRETTLDKLYYLFILKYLYYFFFGIFAYIYWDKVHRFFVDRFLLISAIYIVFFIIVGNYLGYDIISYIIRSPFGLPANFLLALWTLSCAFSYRTVSNRLLHKTDISYGIYIYHMPVINYLNHHKHLSSAWFLLVAFVCVASLAWLSWIFIEEKALRIKHKRIVHT